MIADSSISDVDIKVVGNRAFITQAERKRLQNGILASSWQEVETLLQDYDA